MNTFAKLLAAQAARVAELEAELAAYVEAEDEYHAAGVREDLVAARSLARLLHPAETPAHAVAKAA